ncbi:MAG TPA: hypothetical protein VG406_07010 [Isosphaeraceae bacterium]|jgi:hypothetical protein|nr:hypothetical protein [Isosphaeraceae bacterium]
MANRWYQFALIVALVAAGRPAVAQDDDLPPLPATNPVPGPPAVAPLPAAPTATAAGAAAAPADGPSASRPLGRFGPAVPAATTRPAPLRRSIAGGPPAAEPPPAAVPGPRRAYFRTPVDPPIGYSGPSSVLPTEPQTSDDFVPVEDRWRIGFPFWDRYGRGTRADDDYPYHPGTPYDPFNQNVFKGDYPIAGQHTFMEITPASLTLLEGRTIPTPTTPFESTSRPDTTNFFGRPGQFLFQQNFVFSVDLFHGDAGFKPVDWRVKITPIFNLNNFAVQELGNTSPNVLQGNSRFRTFFALQEFFVEAKIADLSPDYDSMSIRAGNQPFVSDFRAFLFGDLNRAIRLFGNLNGNRDQFNLVYFSPWEKDTNSFLNTFNNRNQNLIFANWYRQDFLFPGYTAQLSVNFDDDQPTVKYDKNRFLVRPDPTGVFKPHHVDVVYLGWAGDGHIGRFNLTHQFYWAVGRDSLNPIANRPQAINAQFFAVEASYDRDWARFRTSYLYSSGDGNPNNGHATGFDTILNNFQFVGGGQQFAGGTFSFWQRQNLPLFGVNLVNRGSLIPDLRSSQIQGQANFVNPGLNLVNFGVDFDLTPRLKMINNMNLLWFDNTAPLEQFLFDGHINRFIGVDLSMGYEYRPLVSDNISFLFGAATLIPGQGYRDLFDNLNHRSNPLAQLFLNVVLAF